MTGFSYGRQGGATYGVRSEPEVEGNYGQDYGDSYGGEPTGEIIYIGEGATYGTVTEPPTDTSWLIGRSRVDGIEGEHPTLTINETSTFNVVLTPQRLANHIGRYEQLRDRLMYASDTVTTGTTYDGRPWFTERHNDESLVVKVQPGRDRSLATRGVWGIIVGGDDATTLPGTLARLSVDILVLAELRDYPNREAVIADLGR